MKIARINNATRNIRAGLCLQVFQIFVPFFMRSVMIYMMGIQYLGLSSLFSSVLQVLNLAELGVGSAMVYSMYKPIAEDDDAAICALLKLYRTYYRVIGLVIAVVGCALTPIIPYIIKSDVPAGINIYVLYLLNLSATVLSYWLFAYKISIFQAHQRTDIVSKVSLVITTIQYCFQVLILWLFHNYYLYVIVILAGQAVTNIVTAICADRLYPQYKPRGIVDRIQVKRINQRIRDLFTSKIGAIIYDSADTIVISAFLGLTVLAVYQNYFYILNAITGFINVVFVACTAGIGNSIVMDSKEKNYQDLNKFTFIIAWLAGFCSVCLLCIYQPFMELWVGKDLMLSLSAVVCFVIYFFVRQFNALFNLYKDASGMWHEDRLRPLAAASTNLVLNLILVQFIDIYGILLSTVLAILCVGMPWLLHNLFTVIFEKKHMWHFIWRLAKYTFVVFISCVVTYFICSTFSLGVIPTILVRGTICLIVPNIIYYLAFRKTKEFQQSLQLVDKMTKGKMSKVLVKLGME